MERTVLEIDFRDETITDDYRNDYSTSYVS